MSSEVVDMIKRYREIRQRLRYPPNAVPDTGINLKKPKYERRPPPDLPKVVPLDRYLDLLKTKKPTTLTFWNAINISAAGFGLRGEDLKIKTRKPNIVLPRQVAIYIAAKQKRWTFFFIARHFKLDHTTAIHARDRITFLIERDPELKEKVQGIEAAVAALPPPPPPPTPAPERKRPLAKVSAGNVPGIDLYGVDSASRSTLHDP